VTLFSTLLAQEDPPTNNTGQGSPIPMMLMVLVVGAFIFFMIIRPMKKQEKERKTLLESLKKNVRVLTSGGIIGVIVSIRDKDEEVLLKVDENSNVRLRVTRSSIVRVLSDRDASKDATEEKT
jgi:preprotein translocase subunit YajC